MNIIIPMAGQGKRFTTCGFHLPKPLINVASRPMYSYAVDCMPLNFATQLIFLLRKNGFSDLLAADIEKR